MKRARAGITRGAEKGVREISQLLSAMGCKLKKVCEGKYQVITNDLEDTGLLIFLSTETTEDRNTCYVLAIMTFPVPENDSRFHLENDCEDTSSYPHVKSALGEKTGNALLFEFIAKCVHYFIWTKTLRKWFCYNCHEKGYEVFRANGTIVTIDSQSREFTLVIVGKPKDIRGIVFDSKIGKNVWPICADCREHLHYEIDTEHVEVDKSYFQRLLARWPESGQVMMPFYDV